MKTYTKSDFAGGTAQSELDANQISAAIAAYGEVVGEAIEDNSAKLPVSAEWDRDRQAARWRSAAVNAGIYCEKRFQVTLTIRVPLNSTDCGDLSLTLSGGFEDKVPYAEVEGLSVDMDKLAPAPARRLMRAADDVLRFAEDICAAVRRDAGWPRVGRRALAIVNG